MSQLHLYVPKNLEERLRAKAAAKGLPLSKFLAEVVRKEVSTGWPEEFFTRVAGGWQGEPLERPPQGDLETRDPF